MSSTYSVWNMDACLGCSNSLCSCFWIWSPSGWLCFGAGFQPPCALGSLYLCFFPSSPPSCLGSRPLRPPHCFSMMLCFHDELLFPSLLFPHQSCLDLEIVDMPLLSTNFLLRNHTTETCPPPPHGRGREWK